MELPRKILIGEGVISHLGYFIRDLNEKVNKVSLISGNVVKSRSEGVCTKILNECSIDTSWHIAPAATIDEMVTSCRRAVLWLHENMRQFNGDPQQLYIIGNSAGAHLAAMIMEKKWMDKNAAGFIAAFLFIHVGIFLNRAIEYLLNFRCVALLYFLFFT